MIVLEVESQYVFFFLQFLLTMSLDRVVVLIDMDCFYVQVEQRDKPELKGKPCAVVQYKTYKGGG